MRFVCGQHEISLRCQARIGAQQAVDQATAFDKGQRCIEAVALALKGFDGIKVSLQRLALGAQLFVGVGNGQARLKGGGVFRVTLAEREPGHQG